MSSAVTLAANNIDINIKLICKYCWQSFYLVAAACTSASSSFLFAWFSHTPEHTRHCTVMIVSAPRAVGYAQCLMGLNFQGLFNSFELITQQLCKQASSSATGYRAEDVYCSAPITVGPAVTQVCMVHLLLSPLLASGMASANAP